MHNLSELYAHGQRHQAKPNYTEPDLETPWGTQAKTRMDWHNVAHVLETFAQHGGAKALERYISHPTTHDDGA